MPCSRQQSLCILISAEQPEATVAWQLEPLRDLQASLHKAITMQLAVAMSLKSHLILAIIIMMFMIAPASGVRVVAQPSRAQGDRHRGSDGASVPHRSAKGHVKALVGFGDSYIDGGNNKFIQGSTISATYPPYGIDFIPSSGRFTDGKTMIEVLGERFGPPSPKTNTCELFLRTSSCTIC